MLAIREKVNISERRACRLVGLSRSVLHYDAKPDHENEVLAARLVELAHERRRFGYRRLHALVEREGTHANHKRIYRLYREAGLRTDQGPEFTSRALDQWAYANGVTLKLIQAGKPTQNAYIESFNGKFRDECLNEHWFTTLAHARAVIAAWRQRTTTSKGRTAH